jgi:shikimate dehydrogenase
VTARTPLFAILAHPVSHLRAPEIFNAYLQARSCDGVMVALDVPPPALATTLATLRALQNLRGFCVSNPHKQTILPLLDRWTEQAERVGAVNVVRREDDGTLVGAQADGEGFIAGLCAAGHAVEGRRVFMAGAGGVAAGIAFALAAAGVAAIGVHNRTRARAEALVARIRSEHPDCNVRVVGPDPSGYEIIINATSAGVDPGDGYPLDVSRLAPGMLAAEVVMAVRETPFLRVAAERGCALHHGDAMARAQMAFIAEFTRALPADRRMEEPS